MRHNSWHQFRFDLKFALHLDGKQAFILHWEFQMGQEVATGKLSISQQNVQKSLSTIQNVTVPLKGAQISQ